MQPQARRLVAVIGLVGLMAGPLVGEETVSPLPQKTDVSPAVPVSAENAIEPNPADSEAVQTALASLLKLAQAADKTAPDQIATRIKSLDVAVRHDPRVYYLHGLSLLKNQRRAEALAEMRVAATQPTCYFPVQRVLIYEQIREKQYSAAIDALVELSARVGDPSQIWTSEDDRLAAARWLGRTIAYLTGPCGNREAMDLAQQADPAIRAQLPAVFLTELEGGVNELHAEHRALQLQLLAAAEQASVKKSDEIKKQDQKQAIIDSQKKELTTSAREQAAIQKEQLKEIDSQLAALEKQYVQLQQTHDKIVEAIGALRVQIATTPINISLSGPVGLNLNSQVNQQINARASNFREALLAMREAELLSYMNELNQTLQKQNSVFQKAELKLVEKQELLVSLHLDDQKRQEASQALKRWQTRASSAKKKISEQRDQLSSTVKSRIGNFSTYDGISIPEELSRFENAH